MHGAVQVHGRLAGFVRSEDGTHISGIGDIGAALVMNDDVEVLVPIFGLVDLKGGLGALVWVIGDVYNGVNARFNTFFQSHRLLVVLMTAATRHDEHAEGLGWRIRSTGEKDNGTDAEGENREEKFHFEEGRNSSMKGTVCPDENCEHFDRVSFRAMSAIHG